MCVQTTAYSLQPKAAVHVQTSHTVLSAAGIPKRCGGNGGSAAGDRSAACPDVTKSRVGRWMFLGRRARVRTCERRARRRRRIFRREELYGALRSRGERR